MKGAKRKSDGIPPEGHASDRAENAPTARIEPSRKIIDYRELIEHSTKGFMGRNWVREAVDEFLEASGPRTCLILGEPGSGKTAFMADLVSRRHYPHHFIGKGSLSVLETSRDWTDPVRFAESIGYQLLRDYGGWVMDWEAWGIHVDQRVQGLEGLLTGAHIGTFQAQPRTEDHPLLTVQQEVERFGAAAQMVGVFIEKFVMDVEQVVRQLVAVPMRRICERYPDVQVVLVVDGLDEAEDYSNSATNIKISILRLLPGGEGPANVRLIASSRSGGHLTNDFKASCKIIWLSEDETGQCVQNAIEDARAYLDKLAIERPVAEMLARQSLSPHQFSTRVASASRGNFLYLYHYAQGLRDGDEALLDLEKLPQGLYGIYGDFLTRIAKEGGDLSWDMDYKPVLGVLAVAREPLTRPQIAGFSGVQPGTVGTILSRLKQFLDTTDQARDRRYAFYHMSFGEYLISEENEDYIDGITANTQIAGFYQRKYGKDLKKLLLDPYAHRYFTRHMADAGQWEPLRNLVTGFEPRGDQQDQPWSSARYAVEGSYTGYRSDLRLLWDWSREQQDIALSLRCALINTSIHSLSGRTGVELLVSLATIGLPEGRWSVATALEHVRQMGEGWRKTYELELLANSGLRIPGALGLEITDELMTVEDRACSLAVLASHLDEQDYPHALSLIQSLPPDGPRAYVLATFSPYLPSALIAQAIFLAREIDEPGLRAYALAGYVRHLPGAEVDQVCSEVINLAQQSRDPLALARVLMTLGSYLSADLFPAILSLAYAVPKPEGRFFAIAALAPYLPADRQLSVYADALGVIDGFRVMNMVGAFLGPGLPSPVEEHDPKRRGVFAKILDTTNDQPPALAPQDALAELAPVIPIGLLPRFLRMTFRYGESGFSVLASLFPSLPADLQARVSEEALQVLLTFDSSERRATNLGVVAPYLSPSNLLKALEETRAISEVEARALALVSLWPSLSQETQGSILEETLSAIRSISDPSWRTPLLIKLLHSCPPERREEIATETLTTARTIDAPEFRNNALLATARYLPGNQQPFIVAEALAAARRIEDGGSQSRLLTALAPFLPPDQSGEVRARAFSAAHDNDFLMDKFSNLAISADYLPDAQRQAQGFLEALAVARRSVDIGDRVKMLAALAPYVADDLICEVYDEALGDARALTNDWDVSKALSALAPHLPEVLLPKALAIARAIPTQPWPTWRADALVTLASRLPEDQRVEILQEALEIVPIRYDDWARAEALEKMTPMLPPALLSHALALARRLKTIWARTHALIALLPRTATEEQGVLCREIFDTVRKIDDDERRARALMKVLPYLALIREEDMYLQALQTAHGIRSKKMRAEVLLSLLPYLPKPHVLLVCREILALVRAQDSAILPEEDDVQSSFDAAWRAETLVALSPFLPDEQIPTIYAEVLTSVRVIRHVNAQVTSLLELIPRLPIGEQLDHLLEVLQFGCTNPFSDSGSLTEVLAVLAPHLAARAGSSANQDELLLTAWEDVIAILSGSERSTFLGYLTALVPWLAALVEPQVVSDVTEAVEEVCDCWP